MESISASNDGIDDVGRHAHGEPAVAGPVAALDQHPGDGLGAPREDTDLVIDQLEIGDEALIAAEIFPQRVVERVDRAVALADRHHALAVDAHLDGRLRHGDQLAQRVVPPLDQHAERIHLEELRHVAEHAPGQQLERGFGRLIGIAHRLVLLHHLEQARDARIVLRRDDADALQLGEDVGAATLVGDQQPAPVAHRLGRDMLVGARVLLHGRDMDAAFMGEGRFPDIGRVPVGRAVQHLVENARGMGQRAELVRRDPGLEPLGIARSSTSASG